MIDYQNLITITVAFFLAVSCLEVSKYIICIVVSKWKKTMDRIQKLERIVNFLFHIIDIMDVKENFLEAFTDNVTDFIMNLFKKYKQYEEKREPKQEKPDHESMIHGLYTQ